MAQPPFQADVYQIEPGSGQTLLISREPTTGSMQFQDNVVTTPITVGKSGAGAEYTTLQSAFDAIPSTSSLLNPNFVFLAPGIYQENAILEKDGVFIWALGGAQLINSGVFDTLTIQGSVGSTPHRVEIMGLEIKNTEAAKACVSIQGGAASTVGNDLLKFLNCNLLALGAGGYQIDALSVNNILVQGGSWLGSNVTSLSRIQQVASFELQSTLGVQLLQLNYDSTGVIPSILTSAYRLLNVPGSGNIASVLSGTGALELRGSSGLGAINMAGDRVLESFASQMGNLTVNGTTAATLRQSSRGTIAGAGTLAEPILEGSLAFAASSSETYNFAVDQPDTSYTVSLEYEVNSLAVVKNKSTTSFDIEFPGGPQTTGVNFTVTRRL